MIIPKARAAALLAGASLSLGAVAAVPAGAATTQNGSQAPIEATSAGWGQAVPMTGTAKNGKTFTGKFNIKRFVYSGEQLYAVGDLTGKLKGRHVNRRNVRIPAAVSDAATARAAQAPTPTPNACQVLKLDLGALDLNLLGLRVQLAPVHLLIEAVPSGGGTGGQAGGLLGDLLCGVTNLLAPSANSPLDAVTRLLNSLLALLGPAPTGLR